VQSTPSFFINSKLYTGGMTIQQIEGIVEPLLKK
jgi:protein-disulfide isomerase